MTGTDERGGSDGEFFLINCSFLQLTAFTASFIDSWDSEVSPYRFPTWTSQLSTSREEGTRTRVPNIFGEFVGTLHRFQTIDINDTPSVSSPSRRKKRAYGQLRELSYEFPWVVGGIIGEYLIPEDDILLTTLGRRRTQYESSEDYDLDIRRSRG